MSAHPVQFFHEKHRGRHLRGTDEILGVLILTGDSDGPEASSSRSGRPPVAGWSRRDVLRIGLTGASALAVGALGGFAIGRTTAPAVTTPHPIGELAAAGSGASTFPIGVAPDGRSFVDANGRPFYYLADTAWNALSRMTNEAFETLASARRERGFTALQMSVLDFQPSAKNAYGHKPFTATGAIDQPLVEPDNQDYWGTIDRSLDVCERLGLVVCLVPSWYGGWGDAWRGYLTPDKAAAYSSFLAERFGGRSNLWWLLGGDNAPTNEGNDVQGVPGDLDRGPRVEHTIVMGRVLADESAVKPLMSYHTSRTETVEDNFGAEPWYQISAAYSGADPIPFVTAEYERQTVRPVVLWEAYYDERTRDPILDRRALRAQAYHALLAGAAGFAYGHEQVWPVLEGWVAALDAPSARDMEIFSMIVATVGAGSLTPVSGATGSVFLLPDGYGTPGTTSAVTAALLPAGRGALAYFGETRASVVIDTTVIDPAATFGISWIDPATGQKFFFGEDRAGTDIQVSWPSSWPDAVLVVER